MLKGLKKSDQNSPHAVIRLFDEAYQKKTGDASLFDLSEPTHLHPWGGGENFNAPRNYWRNYSHVKKAVYHTLTEHAGLKHANRADLIQAIKNIPAEVQSFFYSIGLGGLMENAFKTGEQNSPLAVLKVFDQAYMEISGDASLFDLSKPVHLHPWGWENLSAPKSYWTKTSNVEETIYHTLIEQHKDMASQDRAKVIEAIISLPAQLRLHLRDLGLGGLMMSGSLEGKRDSPIEVIRVFDQAYQKRTGDASLFDNRQEQHIAVNGRNIMVKSV